MDVTTQNRATPSKGKPTIRAISATLAGLGIVLLVFTVGRYLNGGKGEADAGPAAGKLIRSGAGLRDGTEQSTLKDALSRGWMELKVSGNGLDTLRLDITPKRNTAFSLEIPAGSVFESDEAVVVTVRPRIVTVAPGKPHVAPVACVAVHATNRIGEQEMRLADGTISELAVLIPSIQKRPELHMPAIQVAVLAIMDNLPLSAFSQFHLAAGASPYDGHPEAFRVHVRYIIAGLLTLKQIGYPLERLALLTDPQLKIEGMVDPLSHASTIQFYGITRAQEWSFWREHLLNGPIDTRHYALFGIARYYPDTALRMMPEWALKSSLDIIYRESAVRALAQTNNEGALPVLQSLREQLRVEPEMVKLVDESIARLKENLENPGRFQLPVPFRITNPDILPLPEEEPIPPTPVAS